MKHVKKMESNFDGKQYNISIIFPFGSKFFSDFCDLPPCQIYLSMCQPEEQKHLSIDAKDWVLRKQMLSYNFHTVKVLVTVSLKV